MSASPTPGPIADPPTDAPALPRYPENPLEGGGATDSTSDDAPDAAVVTGGMTHDVISSVID